MKAKPTFTHYALYYPVAKRMGRITFYVLLFSFCVLAFPSLALAQDSNPTDDDVNAIAKQLYCPVCENTPLDVCPTEACRQWRELIRQQLAEGKSEQEIKDYFVKNYGARVLGEPPRKGLNWLVYIVPPFVIAAGIIYLIRAFMAWKKPATVPAESKPTTDAPKDKYVARLEEELKKRK